MAVAEAGAGPEPKLWPKSEPEINNFGSAKLLKTVYFLKTAIT